jgi:hypothetical protein
LRKLILTLLVAFASLAHAQAATVSPSLIAGDQLWRIQNGDNPAWLQPHFDDSAWPSKTLGAQAENLQSGWRWYRLRVPLPASHAPLGLLIVAPENEYEVYVNGTRLPGAEIRSSLHVYGDKEHVFPLPDASGSLEIAIRMHYRVCYTEIYGLHLESVALGPLPIMESERRLAEDRRLLHLVPSNGINLSIILAAFAVLGLYLLRRSAPEYLWLGLYLALVGWTNLLWFSGILGFLPLWINNYLGDTFVYPLFMLEVEFVFAFARRPVTRFWRAYQVLLVAGIGCNLLTTAGVIPAGTYALLEGLSALPVALLQPALLLLWWFRGDREARWLILPTLLPAFSQLATDVPIALQKFGRHDLDFLLQPLAAGPVFFNLVDLIDLAFLLSVGFVMLLRFNRIARDQATAEAELESARTVQQVLIPEALPDIPGFRIESVYYPAQQVGGDFFQILQLPDGGVLAIIGDVSGKGLPAAMMVAVIVGAIRSLAEYTESPGELLAALNRRLHGRTTGFATAAILRVSPSGQVWAANAGHLHPYLAGQEIALDDGLPLGLLPDATYDEVHFTLEPGTTLTLLTDGVVEAIAPKSRELFGFERTAAISTQSAESIAEAAQRFGSGAPQADDITVLTLQLV